MNMYWQIPICKTQFYYTCQCRRSLSWENPLEEGMATHPSILAWRIPWTEELGGLQSMGSQSVRHNRVSNALALAGRFLTTEPAWEAPNWIQSLTGLGLCFLCPFCTNALLFLPWPTHTHLCQHSDQYPTPLEPSLTFRPYHPHSHSHCQPGIKTPILHPHTELHHSS